MYSEIRRVPLIIRLPGESKGNHVTSLVEAPDLMPTMLEIAGLVTTEVVGGQTQTQTMQCGVFYDEEWKFDPASIHGKSLMPLMRGETNKLRDIAVSSNTLIYHTPLLAKSSIVTEDGWCLHYAGKYDKPDKRAKMGALNVIDPEGSHLSTAPELYYLPSDPCETRNVIDENVGLASEIHARYVHWLEENNTPPEHLAGRRLLR